MKLLILSALSLISITTWAQTLLYNDGATLVIQSGAVLYVEGGIQNANSGIINNNGTLELKGDLLNQATFNSATPSTVKFSGDQTSNVTSGGATFNNIEMAKTTTYSVKLLDAMAVSGTINFSGPLATGNKIRLGANNLTLGTLAAITNASFTSPTASRFIVTNGVGSLKKTYTSTGSFAFPVGVDSLTYNPATINVTAGVGDTYRVRVLASPTDGNGLTGTPITTKVVNAVWDIGEGVAGGNTYDLTLGWQASDELTGFSETANAVSKNDGTNGWDALFANLGGSGTTRTRTALTTFGAFAVGGQPVANSLYLNAKVLLEGPWVTAAGMMYDSLRRNTNLIPLSQPYTDPVVMNTPYVFTAYGGTETVASSAVFDQPADGDDIVDWIVTELRSNPWTVVATKTGLLQRDGNIVDLDGVSPLSIQGVADGSYYIGIKHRNHLAVRSAAAVALSNTPSALVDFTVLATSFDSAGITVPPEPTKLLTGTTYGLWAGDVNFNRQVLYNGGGNDRSYILAVCGAATPTNPVTGYLNTDVNMNRKTLYNGGGNDRSLILANCGPTTPTVPLKAHINN